MWKNFDPQDFGGYKYGNERNNYMRGKAQWYDSYRR